MDPDFLETEAPDSSRDGLNTQGVYIYRPAKPNKPQNERPSKRRKVESDGQERQDKKPQGTQACPFVPLLNGEESASSVDLRYNAYQRLWSKQEAKIQEVLEDVDSKILEEVSSFVKESSAQVYDGCIPSALMTVGSNVSSLGRLLARLNERLITGGEGGVVVLESGDAPNIKTTLKNIIRGAVTNTEGNDGYQNFLTDREGPRLLAYDLDLLSDYVQRKGATKLVLAFRDSEAFDPNLLTDLLSLLSSWLDRIPFTLLFGISTSVELFEGRLPRSSVALLRGKYFELHEASNCVDRIYEKLQAETDGEFWLGRNITGVLFERTSDYFHTPEAFCRTVKYAYMSHFFANPLAVMFSRDFAGLPHGKLCQTIRNLPSFRRFCEDLVEDGHPKQVRNLLENDAYLFQECSRYLETGQQQMRNIFVAVKMTHAFLKHLNLSKKTGVSDISILALSGELHDSQIVGDILNTMKTLDSDGLKGLLATVPETLADNPQLREVQADFEALLKAYPSSGPLRSGYDSRNSITKATVVQQRVQVTKSKAKQPKQNVEYTQILDRFHATLQAYFAGALVKPQDLFLYELFLLDMKNPLKDTFAPRPRFAIERALSSPFDYLMSTSDTSENRLSAKQPATAILYQLYLESGAIVNAHDLWSAFYAVFESDQGDKCDERVIMALFYRALSELKALGVVKNSRKKVDHIAKTSWAGL
ncbi:putative origin recognition complex subunit 3 [Aspergillus chevalieri]|uniref:Origin recognition complex subunit 3 n=1 Tax=Aspergillus chevalieri TaxID=182096 RepID=A0A7R7VU34_ASPCH|nr:uncharacterized protein ACHE_60695S [Aspergillus chevalieri]BCR90809.1 hypothetical protein ACHE_60695S [Aspergillus chevalieri]